MPPVVSELLARQPRPASRTRDARGRTDPAVYEAGDLRSIRLNGVDVINRIYGAIRDHTWATIPGRRSELVVEAGPQLSCDRPLRTHRRPGGLCVARGDRGNLGRGDHLRIRRRGEGSLRPESHRPVRAAPAEHLRRTGGDGPSRGRRDADGPVPGGRLDRAAGRRLRGRRLGARWPLSDHVDADLTLEGDLFETEDQRNWIDPTFKTFSTPLRLPRPAQVEKGTRIRQRVVLRIVPAEPGSVRAVTPAAVTTDRDRPADVVRTPGIGVAVTHANHDPSEIDRLRTLGLAHVRVDLAMGGDWESRLAAAAALGSAIGSSLELALDVGDGDDEWLRRLADALPDRPAVARVLVFGRGALITTPSALDAVAGSSSTAVRTSARSRAAAARTCSRCTC